MHKNHGCGVHLLAWAVALCCSASAWGQCAGAAPGASAAAQIVALSGQGETRTNPATSWSQAALAQQLWAGADVRTLALSSAALLLHDRTQIRMAAHSLVRLCPGSADASRLELAVGRLWARAKRQAVDVQLHTPAAVAAVRGTDWDVEVDAQGHTTLTVLSGRMEVFNAQGRVELGPAEQATVAPGQAPVKRVLVHPRTRVQWVMDHGLDTAYWAALLQAQGTAPWQSVADEVQAGRWAQVQTRLQALVAGGAGGPVAERLLAELEGLDGRLDAAQQRLEQVWQRSHDTRAAARRVHWLMALERSADARAWLDRTRSQAPGDSALLLADADWHRLEGAGDAALDLYRQALAQAQEAPDRVAAYHGLGRALLERGDLHAARLALQQAVDGAPAHSAYRAQLATADAEALRLRTARTGFDAALSTAQDDYVGLAGSGYLALRQGDAQGARTQLLKALVIEPRYARAQVWLAMAEYQLGEHAAAFDALERARQADPRDPLPWQIEAQMRNNLGQSDAAMAAAREALTRLPYLKSLNTLASDSQGSANLGKALGDFGLEHWARAYAQQSYDPLWAGSHFFLSDRYESDFSKKSELFQGYLTDPTVFGASERRAPLVLTEGREWTVGQSAERNPNRHIANLDGGMRGFTTTLLPLAWLVNVADIQMWPRQGPSVTRLRLMSPGLNLALGARPTEQLAFFVAHTRDTMRYNFPEGLEFGNGFGLNQGVHSRTQRTDGGASWRWSADSQTWFKAHSGASHMGMVLDNAAWGPQSYAYTSQDRGIFVRHTVQQGPYRLSLGWERVRRDSFSSIYDRQIASPRLVLERYDMPWVAGQWHSGAWTWLAEAYAPRFAAGLLDRYTDGAGNDILPPSEDRGAYRRKLLPRLGASYRWGPGRAVHWAWQESLRAPGLHTLSPVATGAIALDHQYHLAGTRARKHAVQLDWELDARTFLGASLSGQRMANLAGRSGRLFAQNTAALFDGLAALTPALVNAQTTLAFYDQTPVFDSGYLAQASVSVNRVMAPRWSVLGSYLYHHSRNTGTVYTGLPLPGIPRHVLLAQSTWRHTGRSFSLLRMTYRSTHPLDAEGQTWRPAGWGLALAHAWESPDRHWSVVGTLQTRLGQGQSQPTLWVLLRYRGNF